MTKHRVYSVAFKRQVAQEFLSGESGHSLKRRYGLSSRNLIRLWVAKYEAGDFEPDEKRPTSCRSTRRGSRRWSAWPGGRRWSF